MIAKFIFLARTSPKLQLHMSAWYLHTQDVKNHISNASANVLPAH